MMDYAPKRFASKLTPMIIDLSPEHIATILESLEYSKQRITDAQGTPYEVRRENLARVEAAATMLREARKGQP